VLPFRPGNTGQCLHPVKCYFDMSEGVDDAGDSWLTLAGFGAPDAIWRKFDDQWRRVLWERYPVAPHIHMTHLIARKDPFEWGAAGWDQDKQAALVTDAVKFLQTIDKKRFIFSRCSVNVSARKRLIALGHPVADEITLCTEICMGSLFRWHYILNGNYSELLTLHFDQGEQFCRWLKRKWLANRTPPGRVTVEPNSLFWDMIGHIEECDSRHCYPLQPADMAAWAHSRSLTSIDRPFRHLSHIMQQVIPNFRADLTEDVMRMKNPIP
jgi:hypothetical protein